MNATESRDQWTNVLGVSQTPTSTSSLPAGTSLEVYGADKVRLYRVSGMGHGTPVDPGSATDQCGTATSYFLDTICSTYRDALFGPMARQVQPEPTATARPAAIRTVSNYAHVTAGRPPVRRKHTHSAPTSACFTTPFCTTTLADRPELLVIGC
jgi:feruloyl esterase